MKEKKSTVHDILKENGLEITGWETANCGFGIEFPMPVIINKKTGMRLTIEKQKTEQP